MNIISISFSIRGIIIINHKGLEFIIILVSYIYNITKLIITKSLYKNYIKILRVIQVMIII